MKKTYNFLREFSIPLITGVIYALIWANIAPESYHNFVHNQIIPNFSLHFLVNDIFMVFFFAIAAVEIIQSLLPGGDLYPLKRAINPIMATFGGVLGPTIVYLLLNHFFGSPDFIKGWGIPTSTDIALAWLVAKLVFGADHPAVSFLLLLAIADDGIGLLIIALFYPNPLNPITPAWLLVTLAGMLIAFSLKKAKIKSYWPYILFGGTLSWFGLYLSGIHSSLALVFIVPFLPHPKKEKAHLFEDDSRDHSTLKQFEHDWKAFVDLGLLLFGLTNAGVEFSEINAVTWFVFIALLIGKTSGIFIMGWLSGLLGFPLPKGMNYKDLFVSGLVASIGLTVALFVAGVAFTDLTLQGAAKMGALFSVLSAVISFSASKAFKINRTVKSPK
ncbi:Na+/H+ antiporter NhaA [Desulfitobacterium sp. AusDCA]|uniref:Na+/H+ antiporter NhaA n=1 Tax=Desulfitobacterium sp. AusDCA TaxID=3240383 RepID=UPI003DA7440B